MSSKPGPLIAESGWMTNARGRQVISPRSRTPLTPPLRQYNHKFGYGLMDTGAMVDLAAKWRNVPLQHICQSAVMKTDMQVTGGMPQWLNWFKTQLKTFSVVLVLRILNTRTFLPRVQRFRCARCHYASVLHQSCQPLKCRTCHASGSFRKLLRDSARSLTRDTALLRSQTVSGTAPG